MSFAPVPPSALPGQNAIVIDDVSSAPGKIGIYTFTYSTGTVSKYEFRQYNYDLYQEGVLFLLDQASGLYNSQGKIVSEIYQTENGISIETEYFYNGPVTSHETVTTGSGLILTEVTFYSNGKNIFTNYSDININPQLVNYNGGTIELSDAQRTSHATTYVGGKLIKVEFPDSTGTRIEYDAQGRPKQFVNSDTSDLKTVDQYSYDDAGIPHRHLEYAADGTVIDEQRYDAVGNLTYEVKVDAEGTKTSDQYVGGSLTVHSTETADGTRTTIKYDGSDHVIEKRVTQSDGFMSLDQYRTDQPYAHRYIERSGNGELEQRFDAAGRLIYEVNVAEDGAKTTMVQQADGQHVASYSFTGQLLFTDLIKLDGSHTIVAKAADITLEGSTHNDQFTSFGGDTFVFRGSFGQDVIRSFHAGDGTQHDTVQIDHALAASLSDLTFSQAGHDTIIHVGLFDTITLKGIAPATLMPVDFLFA